MTQNRVEPALARHLIVDYYDCDTNLINDVAFVEKSLLAAAEKCRATILESVFRSFPKYGVSGVVVIAESHLSIHTWPEYGYVAVDFFTCGNSIDPWEGLELIKSAFGAKRVESSEIARGSRNGLPPVRT